MPKHNTSAYIGCPFFKYYDGCKLCCEGVQDNSNLHLAFASPEDRRYYMKTVCYFDNYKGCIVAKALNKYKYNTGE